MENKKELIPSYFLTLVSFEQIMDYTGRCIKQLVWLMVYVHNIFIIINVIYNGNHVPFKEYNVTIYPCNSWWLQTCTC